MATEDLRFYDGTSWQSLSALAAEQVDAKLPIESDNGTVELTGESETFDVKINDVSQLTVGNDIDFNIPFNNGQFTITGSSYTQQRIKSSKGGCMTQFTAAAGKSYFIGMSDLYGFQVIGTKFSNTKISATDDTFRVFGSPIYTDGVWGNGEKQLVIDASKAEFSIPVWAPRIVGNADNAAFVNLGNSVQIQAGTISGEVVIDSGTTELKAIRDAKVAIKGQNTTQLQVATNTDYCFIQTTNKDNRSFYHGQDPDGWSVYYTGSAKALGCNADGVFKFEKSFCTPGVRASSENNPAEIQLTSNLVFEVEKLTRFNANRVTVVEVNGETFGVGINTVAADKAGLTVRTKVVNPTYGTQGVWSNGSVSATTQAGRFFDSYLSQPIIASASSCEVYHFRAFDNAASTTSGTHAGFVAGNLKSGTTKNYGFWSQVASEAGKTNYAFYASSTASSYLKGGLLTPSIAGLNSTDASINIGAELLTTNHTPTQPNSIATKQTVDDKIVVCTSAEYAALVKNPTTLYCLTD